MPIDFSAVKFEYFIRNIWTFLILLHKSLIVGITNNEYTQSMIWIKNKKKKCIPLYTPILQYEIAVQGGILFIDMFH